MELHVLIRKAFEEDNIDPNNYFPPGDHSAFSCFPKDAIGKAKLLIKEEGVIAGIDLAKQIAFIADPALKVYQILKDGQVVKPLDVAFFLEGPVISILKAERIILNFMQHMSGIATLTRRYVNAISGTKAKILDTRKTTPMLRSIEKNAVVIGGGLNHRFGLYDMMMLKDNHIDFSGGIEKAIDNANRYRTKIQLPIRLEIEARSVTDVRRIMDHGGIDRIMLDNFSISDTREAVQIIKEKYETESSGGIQLDNVRAYAECGVDFISVGAITHSAKNFDLSLKANLS